MVGIHPILCAERDIYFQRVIIFLHIPKTAGTTFQIIHENNFGFSHCHTNHTKKPLFDQADLDFARKVFPRLKSIAGHNLVEPMKLAVENPFHMTILREPVARTFAHYQATVNWGNNRLSFEKSLAAIEGLSNPHVRMMSGGLDLHKAKSYLEKCDFVGLTEKFDLSLFVLQRLYPHQLNPNYHRKTTAYNNTIKNYLAGDPRMVELAREYNQLDLELYDFGVKEIFPKLCEKAGLSATTEVPSFSTYTSDMKWRFLVSRLQNMCIYRQLCKKFSHTPPAALPPVPQVNGIRQRM